MIIGRGWCSGESTRAYVCRNELPNAPQGFGFSEPLTCLEVKKGTKCKAGSNPAPQPKEKRIMTEREICVKTEKIYRDLQLELLRQLNTISRLRFAMRNKKETNPDIGIIKRSLDFLASLDLVFSNMAKTLHNIQ